MLATYSRLTGRHRRGVVLVLILAMLGLLAVIGVTFATFSGQAQVGARYFSQSISDPASEDVMDYALSQLINDTDNPASALRGHSLKRDMYGNDATNNGYLDSLPPYGDPIHVTNVTGTAVPFQFQIATNIPTSGNPALYGMFFGPPAVTLPYAWFVRMELWLVDNAVPPVNAPVKVVNYADSSSTIHSALPQTFQVVFDNVSGAAHVFTLSPTDVSSTNGAFAGPGLVQPTTLASASPPSGQHYELRLALDNRYRNAFNGSGAGLIGRYPNYRLNGGIQAGNNSIALGHPNINPMDEDYDAADLENWFLALQSADGSVMIPSFHRPGIIQVDYQTNPGNAIDDWMNTNNPHAMAKFLRPRKIDHPLSGNSFPDLKPDPTTGAITYDVDNDGDGVNDSVWLDLGYPVQRDATGRMFKPLFSFMNLGLNGRMPLNTAGNLQRITHTGGVATLDHTSHLGVSTSEINPKFALQNEPTGGQVAQDNFAIASGNSPPFATPNPSVDASNTDVSLTQLRNLLAGTRPQVNPLVLPSLPPNNGTNHDTNNIFTGNRLMYMPDGIYQYGFVSPSPYQNDAGPNRTTPPVPGRWGEPSGVPVAPPTDASGNYITTYYNFVRAGQSVPYFIDGRDDNYNTTDIYPAYTSTTTPESADYFDASGSFSLPVERIRRFVTPIDPAGTGRLITFNGTVGGGGDTYREGTGADMFGRVGFLHYFRPPGVPIDYTQTPPVPEILDSATNPYHGYESYKIPVAPGAMAPMPFDVNTTGGNPPTAVGTFDASVNSNIPYPANPSGTVNSYLYGGLMLNEADEMPLYAASQFDAPYGPHDLEWLYRDHDVDGASLDSRLGKLAPVSLTNSVDGGMRRRMFSIDTWDLNNFAHSANTYSNNAYTDNTGDITQSTPAITAPNGTLVEAGGVPITQTGTAVGHRDRRVDLNFPIPVSTNPDDPVRHKWIRETYQLLKQVLPPPATDTPEKLAQLSQYVVNLVDFRDPDCAMTRFVNTDIIYTPATTSAQATIAIRNPSVTPITGTYVPYDPSIPDFDPAATTHYLVQYGMEYNPIAINEVLGYQFQYKKAGAPALAQRMFVELVNTLTQDGNPSSTTRTAGTNTFKGGQLSDAGTSNTALNLTNWDIVLMHDDFTGRPDPFTGQLPPTSASTPTPWQMTPLATPIPALASGGPGDTLPSYYYVMGVGSPPISNAYEPLLKMPVSALGTSILPPALPTGTGSTKYYWLYLRRPADPTAVYTGSPPPNMVVVDSFRFPYSDSGITGTTDSMGKDKTTAGASKPDLYSLQRLQPYRGGQAIGPLAPGSAVLDNHYGYSEQTAPVAFPPGPQPLVQNPGAPPPGTGWYGYYGTAASTTVINNTLGLVNNPTDKPNGYEYFPFNDRDFQSVAELLLVPGVPPGLFAKQFVEAVPAALGSPAPFPVSTAYSDTSPTLVKPSAPNAGSMFTAASGSTGPPGVAFPYLIDKFYYSPVNDYQDNATTPAFNPVYGSHADGWHQMLEYFEVPPPNFGAIGEVAAGANYDWYRQDLRPGQLNLNLIIDEEVFFGLIDDPRLLRATVPTAAAGTYAATPQVVTQIDANGQPSYDVNTWTMNGKYVPTGSYFLDPTRGHWDSAIAAKGTATGPLNSYLTYYPHNMKAAWADFLRMRHGGSNFLFGYGLGSIQTMNPTPAPNSPLPPNYLFPNGWPGAVGSITNTGSPMAEKPFRSLSNSDITTTIMRPASFFPTQPYTNPASPTPTPWVTPGFRDNTLTTTSGVIPQIPPRRLFSFADATPASNASETPMGQLYNTVSGTTIVGPAAPPPTTFAHTPSPLFNPNANLFDDGKFNAAPYADGGPYGLYGTPGNASLGGVGMTDNRQHPYYRTELLQKVMNLTTVRTHQYAVWITVGFFEVVQPGNAAAAPFNPLAVPDQLGQEMGISEGKNVRFRSFFIIDRTRATGFNPANPGDFRDLVIYRSRIE